MDCIDDVCNDHHKGIPSLNGQEALENIKKQDIDLVILDIMMADMDGFEVLRRIREMDKEIPVIFLSARQEEYDKVLGLGLGADDYVTKPFSPGELMARVKVQLRRKKRETVQSQEKLVVGPLELNLSSYEVTVRGKKQSWREKSYLSLNSLWSIPTRYLQKVRFTIMCGMHFAKMIIQ